jgi:hypothetical protein
MGKMAVNLPNKIIIATVMSIMMLGVAANYKSVGSLTRKNRPAPALLMSEVNENAQMSAENLALIAEFRSSLLAVAGTMENNEKINSAQYEDLIAAASLEVITHGLAASPHLTQFASTFASGAIRRVCEIEISEAERQRALASILRSTLQMFGSNLLRYENPLAVAGHSAEQLVIFNLLITSLTSVGENKVLRENINEWTDIIIDSIMAGLRQEDFNSDDLADFSAVIGEGLVIGIGNIDQLKVEDIEDILQSALKTSFLRIHAFDKKGLTDPLRRDALAQLAKTAILALPRINFDHQEDGKVVKLKKSIVDITIDTLKNIRLASPGASGQAIIDQDFEKKLRQTLETLPLEPSSEFVENVDLNDLNE